MTFKRGGFFGYLNPALIKSTVSMRKYSLIRPNEEDPFESWIQQLSALWGHFLTAQFRKKRRHLIVKNRSTWIKGEKIDREDSGEDQA